MFDAAACTPAMVVGMSDASQSGFSEAEREAMRARAAELKAQGRVKGAAKREREEQACLETIAALPDGERAIAERLHVIVMEEAPSLTPKTWYGFPSYARDDKVILFLQPASRFDTRYCTLGFNDGAALDDGPCWPTSYAVLEITPEVDALLRTLVRRAAAA